MEIEAHGNEADLIALMKETGAQEIKEEQIA
jgi:hypothetical protein